MKVQKIDSNQNNWLVLGGTSDAQRFCHMLKAAQISFSVSVATEAGRQLASAEGFYVHCGRLQQEGLEQLLIEGVFVGIIDLTHPHAVEVTRTAQAACSALGLAYFRYRRPVVMAYGQGMGDGLSHFATTEVEAADLAATLGNRILVTGSKACALYEKHLTRRHGKKVIYRVIPKAEVLAQLEHEGVGLDRIIAMMGPITTEMNIATIKHYGIEVIIAKEAGDASGTRQRHEAAIAMGIHLVTLMRPVPEENAYSSLEDLMDALFHENRSDQ